MKTTGKVTQEEIKRKLRYEPTTGIFYWVCNSGPAKAGDVAGCLDKRTGYVRIQLDGKNYLAHRLAWFYMLGRWPKEQIDHIDSVRSNNRFSNLREASHAQNQWNKALQKNNSSGHKGVCWNKGLNKWQAGIRVSNKYLLIGCFETAEAAAKAYSSAARQHFGEFARAQ